MNNHEQIDGEPSSWLVSQWAAAGIVSAAGRFVPIPFVDDIIRERCRRFVVARTLAAHQQGDSLEKFNGFYTLNSGFMSGFAGSVIKAPLKLLLFPIRKAVAIITSVRGVPLEIMRVILIGRTLDRYLRLHLATATMPPAKSLRLAFDTAFNGMDFRTLRAATADALSSVGGWKKNASKAAKQVGLEDKSPEAEIIVQPQLTQEVAQVRQILEKPETLRLFAEFDRRLDNALLKQSRAS